MTKRWIYAIHALGDFIIYILGFTYMNVWLNLHLCIIYLWMIFANPFMLPHKQKKLKIKINCGSPKYIQVHNKLWRIYYG
jgi:biotin transporter BioY